MASFAVRWPCQGHDGGRCPNAGGAQMRVLEGGAQTRVWVGLEAEVAVPDPGIVQLEFFSRHRCDPGSGPCWHGRRNPCLLIMVSDVRSQHIHVLLFWGAALPSALPFWRAALSGGADGRQADFTQLRARVHTTSGTHKSLHLWEFHAENQGQRHSS
jgi:hypothetical protein